MINLLSYITPETIFPLQDDPYSELLEEIAGRCLADYHESIRKEALEEIRKKSRSRSPQDINLGKGFALVHAKIEELTRIHVAVGILPKPKKLLKGDRIHTLFGMFLPTSESRHYLSMLARLGRLLQEKEASRAFSTAGKLFSEGKQDQAKEQVMSLITKFEQG